MGEASHLGPRLTRFGGAFCTRRGAFRSLLSHPVWPTFVDAVSEKQRHRTQRLWALPMGLGRRFGVGRRPSNHNPDQARSVMCHVEISGRVCVEVAEAEDFSQVGGHSARPRGKGRVAINRHHVPRRTAESSL